MSMTREMKNTLETTGVVVKHDIKEFVTKSNNEDAIGGSIVIRTEDGSENEFKVFAKKWKKDTDGNETNETTYFFNEYSTFVENVVTLEDDAENPSVVSITQGTFGKNDYKNKDGKVVSGTVLNGKFLKILSDKEISTKSQIAKFDVEGIIEKIEDELDKDRVPTGKGKIKFNHILSKIDFKDKNKAPEAQEIFPIILTVPEKLYGAFKTAGYFEGCLTKFIGELKNTVTVETVVEQQAFGEDNVKEITHYVREFEIKSGTAPNTFDTIGLSQEDIAMLVAKRKQELEDIKNGTSNNNNEAEGTFGGNGNSNGTTNKKPSANPFNIPRSNLFA